ncbi:MAG: cobalamin-dependent protein [Alphaproteobacteria bacterium]|nr:cobalamin-dependent protein [Alphaproteobacteria bacterium]
MQKLRVFLADLRNGYFPQIRSSVPLGMGYVAAYLQKRFGDEIHQQLFIDVARLYDELRKTRPDIVAFGAFAWNAALTNRAVRITRELAPNALIVVGGAEVSHLPECVTHDFKNLPEVDFAISYEAEMPMANLVAACISAKSPFEARGEEIRGCLTLSGTSKGAASFCERITDLSLIPSPYLSGFMDPFLTDPSSLPLIQASRGCPYRCTYCVSGNLVWNKLRAFQTSRVLEEIDYVRQHAAIANLRFADDNFGLLERDLEIAEYLADLHRNFNFPHTISLYTDKHPSERVLEINRLLAPMQPFNISLQSVTPGVLATIKRINIKQEGIKAAVAFARNHSLMPVTEVMFPLPEETVQTFFDGLDSILENGFESIAISFVTILKHTALDQPEEREKYRLETGFVISPNGFTLHERFQSVETQELVIATNSVSRQEYFDSIKLIFLYRVATIHGFFRELLFFFMNYDIRPFELFSRILTDSDEFPCVSKHVLWIAESVRALLFHSAEQAAQHYLSTPPSGRSTSNGILWD